MQLDQFDYCLPEALIALRPARPRDAARLLVAGPLGACEDRVVSDAADIFRPGDVLVVNDTRVLRAALTGIRAGRQADAPAVAISLNLIERLAANSWRALARPGKRLRVGDDLAFGEGLGARLLAKGEDGTVDLCFNASGAALDAGLEAAGAAPLPPYIAARRSPDAQDLSDYQTVFARHAGAVAAPTAGLHFTDALLARLDARGVARVTTTLHVGAGTFLPVKSERVEAHLMHAEWREVSEETADAVNRARADGRRIIAIGTTALRALESAVDENGVVRAVRGETSIFITPGHQFKVFDGLWTNFHLPRSTLFMLAAAFCGLERVQAIYQHAIARSYRFYSYGDASLLWRTR